MSDDHCLLWNFCDSQVVGNNYKGREKLKSLGIGEKMEAVFWWRPWSYMHPWALSRCFDPSSLFGSSEWGLWSGRWYRVFLSRMESKADTVPHFWPKNSLYFILRKLTRCSCSRVMTEQALSTLQPGLSRRRNSRKCCQEEPAPRALNDAGKASVLFKGKAGRGGSWLPS